MGLGRDAVLKQCGLTFALIAGRLDSRWGSLEIVCISGSGNEMAELVQICHCQRSFWRNPRGDLLVRCYIIHIDADRSPKIHAISHVVGEMGMRGIVVSDNAILREEIIDGVNAYARMGCVY